MRSRILLFLVLLLSATLLQAATVTVSGRQLLVNGQAFTVKGVNYSPTPMGYTAGGAQTGCVGPYTWWLDSPSYVADFPQIRQMGANTVRTFNLMNSTATATQVRQALDSAQANGLYVIMGYYVSHTATIASAGFQAQTQADFLAAVTAYKNHPAVLMWAFGNENNLENGNNNPAWYAFLQQVAGQAKALDPFHPIMTVEGECLGPDCSLLPGNKFSFVDNIGKASIGADDTSLSFVDIWGINVYRGRTAEGIYQALAVSTMTAKPVLVTEFGKDAWHDSTSAEDATMQSDYLSSQWQEINANLSATGTGTASLAGGAVFEWTDEWWKDSADDCSTHGTPVLFHRTSDTTDPNYQDEWFGITTISAANTLTNPNGTLRTLRTGYATLRALWNPTATPTATAAASNFFSDTVRNFPNPFRVGTDPTRFVAYVNDAGTINLSIYDASQQFVTSLPPLATTGAGRYELVWDGHNRSGEYVSPGLYYARIEGKGSLHSDHQFRRVVAVK